MFTVKNNYIHSWSSASDSFVKALANLRSQTLQDDDCHKLINVSSGKYVWRCTVDGFDFAYKTQQGKTPWRYLFRPSLPLREYYHYQWLQQLGIPAPEVLAIGETRTACILKESFIITAFLDNTQDGRIFMPDGAFRSGHDCLRNQFCEAHLRYLAKFHDNGFYHKAFHPRNLLFRHNGETLTEAFWIDVARLRTVSQSHLLRAVVVDLHTFFRDMLLKRQDVEQLLDVYVKSRTTSCPEASALLQELITFRRHRFTNKIYKLFQD